MLIALSAGPASAGDAPVHVINESETTKTIACDAKDGIVVNSGENRLTLTGECGKVVVNGGDNIVAVEAAIEIVVNGAGNKVSYKRGAGGKAAPKTSDLGRGNSIVKLPVASAWPEATYARIREIQRRYDPHGMFTPVFSAKPSGK